MHWKIHRMSGSKNMCYLPVYTLPMMFHLLNCIGYAKRKATFNTGQKGNRSKEVFMLSYHFFKFIRRLLRRQTLVQSGPAQKINL